MMRAISLARNPQSRQALSLVKSLAQSPLLKFRSSWLLAEPSDCHCISWQPNLLHCMKMFPDSRYGENNGQDDVDDAVGEEVGLRCRVDPVVSEGHVGRLVGSVEQFRLSNGSLSHTNFFKVDTTLDTGYLADAGLKLFRCLNSST